MSTDPGFKVVIPARYASSRLPGKPLEEISGKPMIRHVHERAIRSGARRVVIATDDDRIRAAAEAFGAEVCMTSAAHGSGTERVAEVVDRIDEPDEGIVVNVQSDEPLLPPCLIAQVAENLAARNEADIATLCERIETDDELFDPSVVKVVFDSRGFAMYFSRAPIPWHREHFAQHPGTRPEGALHFRHVGLYAYRASYLRAHVRLPACELEQAESLEQLRALHAGRVIHVAEAVEAPGPGVDTAEDLARLRAELA